MAARVRRQSPSSVDRIARRYRRQGYEVVRSLPGDGIEAVPDLIARRDGHTVLVQVKTADQLAGANDLSVLAGLADERPRTRLDLYVEPRTPLDPCAANRTLAVLLEDVERALRAGFVAQAGVSAAFVLMGAVRGLAERGGVRHRDLSEAALLHRMVQEGLMDATEFDQCLAALGNRDRLVAEGARGTGDDDDHAGHAGGRRSDHPTGVETPVEIAVMSTPDATAERDGAGLQPTAADVVDAADRLAGQAVATPLLRSAELDRLTGATILLKPECLQLTGSFKFRGAYNRLSRIPLDRRPQGVVAWSSGNHAQGVAEAARRLDMPATIVMPADAPATKVENTLALGAEIVFYDRSTEDREEIGRRLCAERGATLVPSYDDRFVIAGQGTVGLEIGRQAAVLGLAVDAALVCCSGGGLATGTALGLHLTCPDAAVYTVEPAGFDDMARSLAAGQRVRNRSTSGSACDALLAPMPGDITFPLAQRVLAGGLAVTDADAFAAMRFAFRHLKLVLEPGGAVALAAVLNGGLDWEGRTVAVVLSGGNVDADLFARVLSERD